MKKTEARRRALAHAHAAEAVIESVNTTNPHDTSALVLVGKAQAHAQASLAFSALAESADDES